MIIRMITRKLINVGIDKGVDTMAKRKGHAEATGDQKAQTAQTKKRAKQSMRIMRRMGRF